MKTKPKEVYSIEEYIVAPNTNDIILKGSPIPEGYTVELKVMRIIDLTTANKTMRLGYERAGRRFWFRRRNAGTGNYDLHLEAHLILVEGERPIAMVESPTAGDEIWFLTRGFLMRRP